MATNPNSGSAEGHTTLIHPECITNSRSAQNIENVSDNTIKKDDKGFLFDVIVLRLDILNKSIDQSSKLLVDTNFNGKNLSITSSRIHILDFKPERGIEFSANPLELKEQLSRNPFTVKVSDVADVIGYGRLEWPKEFLSGLVQCDREMKNSFEIELKKCDGTKTGIMHIMVRLQPKCKEYEEDIAPDSKCRDANKEIEPNDVLFMVSEERNVCCCSQIGIIPASESDHDLQPKCLDLSNFRAVNSQNVNKPDILTSLDAECKKLLTVTNHYQKLIDTKKKEYPYKENSELFPTLPSDSSLKMNVVPCNSDYTDFSAKHMKTAALIENPPPELIENEPQTFRCCPVCNENMEYLPKLAACPNCCYKPIPYFKEKPYDDSQSADQILREFHEKLQTNDNSGSGTNSKKDPSQSRCTCKYGSNKPCAHCRIRKLCENIFKPPVPAVKSQDICEPKSSDVHCVSSSDNRPFLTRIFSELKDLFDIEELKEKTMETDERCERELNKKPVTINNFPMKKEIKRTKQTNETDETKEISERQKSRKRKIRSVKPASELAVRSKLYDYQFVKQNCARKLAHKACINEAYEGRKNVPPNMGWLWNINNSDKWKPGAIRKPIKELMRYFLKDFPADTLLVSQYSYRKTSKSGNTCDQSVKALVQKPTLHIQKKNGEYIITMRPLKCRELLKDSADPYENTKPIQFRIVQNPQLRKIRNLKKSLKSMGFKKCTCHRPIMYCYCRSYLDKKRLEYQCKKECSKSQIEVCCDTLVLSDTSDSEAEFDFGITPPVALIKPEKLNKTNLVNVGTQYDELDWNPVPPFPRPPNKYMQMYQCAVRDRKPKSIMVESSGDTGVHAVDVALGRGSFPMEARKYAGDLGKGMVIGSGFAGAKGGGDGLLLSKGTTKGGAVAIDFSGKYGGRGGPGGLRDRSGPSGPSGPGGFKGHSGPGTVRGPSGLSGTGGFRGPRGPGGVGGPGGLASAGGFGGPGGLGGPGDLRGPSGAAGPRGFGGLHDPSVNTYKMKAANIPMKKFDMFKYVIKSKKKTARMSTADGVNKRKEKMNLLRGVNPPLLCMVDRLGKPVDPCAPCLPRGDYRIC